MGEANYYATGVLLKLVPAAPPTVAEVLP
jgi:hypothetical protein